MIRQTGIAAIVWGCLTIGTAQVARGQGRVIQGRVSDSTGMAVSYAGIYERSVGRIAATDSGTFRLELKGKGRLRLEVRRIGFRPATIDLPAGGDTLIGIVMSPVENMLPSMVIQVARTLRGLESRGFYRRMQERERGVNVGHFITIEDIERRNPYRFTQMLDNLPGVRIIRLPVDQTNCLTDHDPACRVPVSVSSGCAMTVYLDGQRLNPLGGDACQAFARGVDELVQSQHIAGIEVYSSAGRVPAEFQSMVGRGGAILIWTR